MGIGTFLSFLTIRINSILPACIAHGAINAIRETPLFIAKDTASALLGPKPSGLIGMSGFIVLALFILCSIGFQYQLQAKKKAYPWKERKMNFKE